MKKTLFLPLMAIVLFSCATPTVPTPDAKLGDVWIIHYKDFNESGGIDTETDLTVTTTEVIFNNESWVQLNTTSGTIGTFKMKSDGMHHHPDASTDELFFTFPGTVSDSTHLHLYGEDYTHITGAVNQITTLPSGNYTSNYYIQNDANSLEAYIWFAANEWFIKVQEFDETTSGPPGMFMDYQYELVSYTPN
jgi:hypothetical protein